MEHLFTDTAYMLTSWMVGLGIKPVWADLILLVVQWAIIIAIVTVNVIILIWLERKVSGFIQERLGPNRLGPFGAFQTIADAMKLLTKEDIILAGGSLDFYERTAVFIVVAVMLYAVLLGKDMAVVDLNVGLFILFPGILHHLPFDGGLGF